eukprot:CAMPEP_0206325144 /NCGR_PEP_ID=MMETSP0106_2-20121207/20907_1 /ASSEMBLY_ACC=CAM_ASM_000206 /TAXON_ID=81532 /ORGANISM="Acanthoeca-like sp., Strain 10tr" /LENGTH=330 /DNA_ID=CAMNT_0053757573 /DNA_START=43 /DNA_END=1035 /DNA_ORIENTATION=-
MSATTTAPAKQWRPSYPVTYAPLFPALASVVQLQPSTTQLKDLLRWFFGYPGFLWPWNVIYLTICYMSHTYTTPEISRCTEYEFGWIAELYLRNLALLWMIAGGWHALLYTFKAQGSKQKYDPRWQAVGSNKFLFKDQVLDNIFWSCGSGVLTWTGYEAYALHRWANNPEDSALYTDWWSAPLYSIGWLLLIPIWREFHFYVGHRALHWKPIYPYIHALHHKNDNPGPWSGLAMHPIEHLIYFSVVAIHFVVPSHPIHFFFNAQHTALTPAGGHSGFEGPLIDGKIPAGSYFHYLHHRYFECNYGEATIPLDKWFGTFRDGLPKGSKKAN